MSLPPSGLEPEGSIGAARPDEVPVEVDLLRADLYRLLDELARAALDDREALVLEFERAWDRFKAATAGTA